jgi:hypothetical protein
MRFLHFYTKKRKKNKEKKHMFKKFNHFIFQLEQTPKSKPPFPFNLKKHHINFLVLLTK